MENGTWTNKLSEFVGPNLDIPIPILHDLITSSVQQHGDKIAMVCKHQSADLLPVVCNFKRSKKVETQPYLQWTHAQLQYGADLLAHGLTQNGVKPGSTIAVLLSGRAEFHMVLRASVKLKCPFTPINLRSAQNAKEIRHMLTLSGAKVVVVEDAFVAERLEHNVPDLMRDMQVKVMAGGKSSLDTYLSLNEIVSQAAEDELFQKRSEALDHLPRQLDDVVFIWFTSGTTSLPKAAPHTNKSLTCNIGSWREVFKLDDQRAWLQILPMNSIVGSSWTLAYLIPGGSVTHVNYHFDVPSIAQAIHTGECTDVLAVPSMIDLLAFSPVLNDPSNKGIDHIIVGGSKILRSHVEKSFQIIKCKRFSPFFGMTEGTSVCTETLYQVPLSLQDPIYAGYANPGSKIRICAPEGTDPVPRGVPGEIVQGGLQKIERYLGGQGKDNFFIEGGETWYRCGDQAIMREDGRIAIVGRYKDMIIRGGMNIACEAVEAVISDGTGIESQIIGIPDEVAGEIPIALIKLPQEDKEAAARVQRCVLDRMGPAYALERVLNLHELGVHDWPKTTSGKVLKRDLRELAQDLLKPGRPAHDSDVRNDEHPKPQLLLDETQLQQYLLERVKGQGMLVSSIDDDFHHTGMDSLVALQLRNAMIRNPKLGTDINLPPNVIFECGNVRRLAAHLIAVNRGNEGEAAGPSHVDRVVGEMSAMVEDYSQFQRHRPQPGNVPGTHTILLTGATGSLGVHILAALVERHDVEWVYCPVRGPKPAQRLEDAFNGRFKSSKYAEKVKVITDEGGKPGVVNEATKEKLLRHLTLIIHAAWPVNFQLSLASFRPHLRHLQSLIQLSLDVRLPQPARMLFCSSMGVALNTPNQRRIMEEPIADFRQGTGSGYTQSKLVAEHVVQKAVEDFGAWACNLRIGQIVGDTKLGLWNENEAPPLMIRSALSLGSLPSLDIKCSWIPVDTLASAIVEIATMPHQKPPKLVYNMCNPRTFSWTEDFLPALAAAGLKFEIVSSEDWIAKLKEYNATHRVEVASITCPAIKLIDFWEKSYGGKKQRHSTLEFDTQHAQADSRSILSAPDVIESGLVKIMLDAWLRSWVSAPVTNGTLS